MIQSWASPDLKAVFEGGAPRGFPPDLLKKTRRLLAQLNAAGAVEDMAAPPGNRLHALQGDLAGRWSLSVNMQHRITFRWSGQGPQDVWFGDYH